MTLEAMLAAADIDETLRLLPSTFRSLFVDYEGLRNDLPLVELACDAARIQPGGRLVVAMAPLEHAAGHYLPGKIVLAFRLFADVDALAATWAHELAHSIDPLRFEADVCGEKERWAKALGPLLLEHRPLTVRDALDVARRASLRSLAARPGALPSDGSSASRAGITRAVPARTLTRSSAAATRRSSSGAGKPAHQRLAVRQTGSLEGRQGSRRGGDPQPRLKEHS